VKNPVGIVVIIRFQIVTSAGDMSAGGSGRVDLPMFVHGVTGATLTLSAVAGQFAHNSIR
jgi:hypothetical protein